MIEDEIRRIVREELMALGVIPAPPKYSLLPQTTVVVGHKEPMQVYRGEWLPDHGPKEAA